MTDCIHNDKRTCFNERLEMVAEIERLKTENTKMQARVGDLTDRLSNWEDDSTELLDCSECLCCFDRTLTNCPNCGAPPLHTEQK